MRCGTAWEAALCRGCPRPMYVARVWVEACGPGAMVGEERGAAARGAVSRAAFRDCKRPAHLPKPQADTSREVCNNVEFIAPVSERLRIKVCALCTARCENRLRAALPRSSCCPQGLGTLGDRGQGAARGGWMAGDVQLGEDSGDDVRA